MPVKPNSATLKHNGVDILNAIRNSASDTYRQRIPVATQDNIREIGNAMMQYQATQNEFLNALVNRIARVIITSKSYENPLRVFKKGMMEYGETIEEIFVNIAKAHPFDPILAEKTVFKREIPDVAAVFHKMNYQNFYKATISQDQLRQAFLSMEGITDLIARIVDSMYTGSEFDEFLCMKHLIEQEASTGRMYPIVIPAPSAATAKEIVTKIKAVSNQLEFMSSKFNAMGVMNFSKKADQILIIDAAFDAVIDVEVLASAFNMSKAEFMGQRVLIDNFGELTGCVAALVDRDWFMVFDNLMSFTENYNGEGLYWNYFYHVWKTFSTSPFANALIFTTTAQSITSVEITGPATLNLGDVAQYTAVVTGTALAPQGVAWSVSGSQPVRAQIDWTGKIMIPPDEPNSTLIITATSLYDPSKTDTFTVQIMNPNFKVTLTGPSSIKKGASGQFVANVEGAQIGQSGVTWSVNGGASANTVIDGNGKLTIGADETSNTVTVRAISTFNPAKSASQTVTVTT